MEPAIGKNLEFKDIKEFHSNLSLILFAMEWRVLLVKKYILVLGLKYFNL
jgi:hypothetical protein